MPFPYFFGGKQGGSGPPGPPGPPGATEASGVSYEPDSNSGTTATNVQDALTDAFAQVASAIAAAAAAQSTADGAQTDATQALSDAAAALAEALNKVDRAGDAMTGNLSIQPSSSLLIEMFNGGNRLGVQRSEATSNPGGHTVVKTRGSIASPDYALNADGMSSYRVQTWNGSDISRRVADMLTQATEDHDATHAGTRFQFLNVVAGGTSLVESLAFDPATGISWLTNLIVDQNRLFRLRGYATVDLPSAATADGMFTYDTDFNAPTFSEGGSWFPLATRAYVDAQDAALTTAYEAYADAGDATVTAYVDSEIADVMTALAGYLPLTGGTLTGGLTINTTGTGLTLESTDAGTIGPTIVTYHNSASPAVNDVIGRWTAQGKDSGGNTTSYGMARFVALNVTDTTESGRFDILTLNGGSLANRVHVTLGMFSANATGGDKGADTLNFSQIYEQNVRVATQGGANVFTADQSIRKDNPFLNLYCTDTALASSESAGGISLYTNDADAGTDQQSGFINWTGDGSVGITDFRIGLAWNGFPASTMFRFRSTAGSVEQSVRDDSRWFVSGTDIRLIYHAATTTGTRYTGYRARGTISVPDFLLSNDDILLVRGNVWDGSVENQNVYMLFEASENHSASALGTRIRFGACHNGATAEADVFGWTTGGLYVGTLSNSNIVITDDRHINIRGYTTAAIAALVPVLNTELIFDTDLDTLAFSNGGSWFKVATRDYVDSVINGLKWKTEVRVATTVAGTLASSFENGDTVDGVTLATGDRILIKNQATATENGIYVVAASGAPARAADADAAAELVQATVFVREGTANADTQWTCTNNSITLGSTNIVFAQVSGPGSYAADGTTLTLTGSTFSITPNGVGNTQLRQGGACSVIGRSANSTGNVADISAAANDRLLARTGDALSFTQLTDGMVPTNTLSLSKLVNASAQYNLIGRTSSGAGSWEQKATSANVYNLLGSASYLAFRAALELEIPIGRNWIENSEFAVAQIGATGTISVSTTVLNSIDMWLFRSSGGTSSRDMSRVAGFNGFEYAWRWQRPSGIAGTGRPIQAHYLEPWKALFLAGKKVRLSFHWRTGADFTLSQFRFGITHGTGSLEPLGVSLISVGGTTAFATGCLTQNTDVTAAANTTGRAISAIFDVPSNVTELAVFLTGGAWSGTASTNDWFDTTGWQLEIVEDGGAATNYEFEPRHITLQKCQRRRWTTFKRGQNPVQDLGVNTGEIVFPALQSGATAGNFSPSYRFPVRMRDVPTGTLYNPDTANAEVRDIDSGADCASSSFENITEDGFNVTCTGNAATAPGDKLGFHAMFVSEMPFTP